MDWKPGTELKPDQTGHPVIWHATLADLGYADLVTLPVLEAVWFDRFWNDGSNSKRLRTFGHKPGHKGMKDKDGRVPHFLCSRGGLGFHTDPGSTRYALQIQLSNPGGFAVMGIEDELEKMPRFEPGLAILLDTWSPHTVIRDPRLPAPGTSKLLVGTDHEQPPDVIAELPKLIEWIPRLETTP